MIISITSLKGGVWKSTLSQNLAVCLAHQGHRVVIIDADANNSCEYWSGLRKEELPKVSVFSISDSDALKKNIQALHQDYDFVIIDGTPSLSKLVSIIMLLWDIVLVPIRPSGLDLHATQTFLKRLEEVKILKPSLKAYLLLNQYDAHLNFSQEVEEVLQTLTLPLLQTTLKTRISYVEAVTLGLGVIEHKDEKAKQEMLNLIQEIQATFNSVNRCYEPA